MYRSPSSERSYDYRQNHNYYGSSNVPSLSSMMARDSSSHKAAKYARADDYSSIVDSAMFVESPNRDPSEKSSMQIIDSQPMAPPAFVHRKPLTQCKNWQYGCKYEFVYDGKSKITHELQCKYEPHAPVMVDLTGVAELNGTKYMMTLRPLPFRPMPFGQ